MRGLITTLAVIWLAPTLIVWALWAWLAISVVGLLSDIFGSIGHLLNDHFLGACFALTFVTLGLLCFRLGKTAMVTIVVGFIVMTMVVI